MSVAATAQGIAPVLRTHGPALAAVLAVVGVTNLLALAGPLFVMAIYDTVIPARSSDLVVAFAALAALLIAGDIGLRALRATALARIGTTVERVLARMLFEKLLALPCGQLTRSGVHQQLSRVKQFESLRDAFSGSLADALLDAPFVPLFFAAILLIAPQVAALMLAFALAIAGLAILTLPRQRRLSNDAGEAARRHTALLHEIADNHRAIRRAGLGVRMSARAGDLAAEAMRIDLAAKRAQSLSQSTGQALVAAANAGAIALATLQAMEGAISFGALIAVMTLAGRALGPVHGLASSALRLQSLRSTARQADAVLGLEDEGWSGAARPRTFRGDLALRNVTVRFDAAATPALSALSLEVPAGQFVVVAGRSGAGKSTLLNTIARLQGAAAGTVSIDGINAQQMAVAELRAAISYAVQDPAPPPGSLRDYLTGGNPDLNDAVIWTFFAEIGAERDLKRLRDGLDTVLTPPVRRRLSGNALRTFALAKCLLKPAPIRMIDDLFAGLSPARAAAIWPRFRHDGQKPTTIVVSNLPAHLADADRLVVIETGRIALDDHGPAAVERARAIVGATAPFSPLAGQA